jgi:uncharacterized peroxidase-related enzyme
MSETFFVDTVPEELASGRVAALYDEERARMGYVPNFTRAFSARPDVYRAWQQLNGAIKQGDLRRYELATLAAARALGSTYCTLAHSKVLAEQFYDADTVEALPAGLDEADAAVMALAEKVARDATSVGQEDLDRLRGLGLTDEEIVDVVLAAAARCFFSTMLSALGATPDAALL